MNNPIFTPALCVRFARAATLSTFASVAIFPPALAQEAEQEIVVTATRTPVSLADSLSSVTVISREELEALQPLDLVDVFQQVPGIDISRSGGPGSTASLFVRGTASDQTLILVDGQRISSATLGSANFQFLDPSVIERIEIVRGASSSLYGSDAIGGVIQIFTRDGTGVPETRFSVGSGSNDLREAGAATHGMSGALRYAASVTHLDTDGIDNLVDDSGFNADRDGYRNTSVNVSTGYRFRGGADLALRLLRSDSRNEYDSAFNPDQKPYSDNLVQNINARLELPVTAYWQSLLSVGRSTDDSENSDAVTGELDSEFRTDRNQLLWQNDFSVTERQTLTLGFDYYDDQVRASSVFEDAQGNPVESRDNAALFAQHQARFERIALVLGLRRDDNEEFGSHTSGNVSLGYDLDERHLLSLSWSEGFNAPTFNDLYWPASAWSAGNPDLLPETSENYEAGLRGNYDTWYWSASVFRNDVKNLIDWAPGPDGVWRPYNVNDAQIEGAELLAGTALQGWRVEGSLSYNDPRDAQQGTVLANRSKRTARLTADRELDQWSLGLSFRAQSERFVNESNSQTLPGYGIVGGRLSYRHNSQLTARLKVDNLLDRDYQLNSGYNQDGINWHLSLSYTL